MVATDLLAARELMAFTLGVHIILVPFGVAFPCITLVANYRWLRHGDPIARQLAEHWSKVMAVLFAVGAVTGTVLSLEMGLLWPGLFDRFGAVIGVPFSVEGLFFFAEAIFIAIYIYGWRRLSPWAHFWSGVPIVIAGLGGTFAVISANAWMNQPAGFAVGADGRLTHVDPLAAMLNRATAYEVPHMLLAAYMVAGFVIASVYAVGILRGRRDRYHRLGLLIPLAVAALATPLQVVVGDVAARAVRTDQPAKFAAMELTTGTGPNQSLQIGGVLSGGHARGAISIPGVDSLLAGGSRATVIQGLDRVPAADRPPATVVHLAFQTMVGIGFGLLALGTWIGWAWWRRRDLPRSRWFLRAVALSGPASVVALEAGWITTEVGRQPWIAYHLLRTRDAVTTVGGVWGWYAGVVTLYTLVGLATVWVLVSMARRRRESASDGQGLPPRGGEDEPVPMPVGVAGR